MSQCRLYLPLLTSNWICTSIPLDCRFHFTTLYALAPHIFLLGFHLPLHPTPWYSSTATSNIWQFPSSKFNIFPSLHAFCIYSKFTIFQSLQAICIYLLHPVPLPYSILSHYFPIIIALPTNPTLIIFYAYRLAQTFKMYTVHVLLVLRCSLSILIQGLNSPIA